MGILGPLLNRSDLSIRNGVQFFRPIMDYACPEWSSAARTHVRRLQVLQSKYICLVTGVPWYVNNKKIYEDLYVPLFADQIRALTASFYSKLADVGNPLVQQIGRYLPDRRLTPSPGEKTKGGRGQHASRGHPLTTVKSSKRIAFGAGQPIAFRRL